MPPKRTKLRVDANGILNRLREVYGLDSDASLARKLEVNEKVPGNWRQRKTVGFDVVVSKCGDVDLTYVFTGQRQESVLKRNVERFAASDAGVTDLLKAQLRECMDRENRLAIENGRLSERVTRLEADIAALRGTGTHSQHSAPVGAAGGR